MAHCLIAILLMSFLPLHAVKVTVKTSIIITLLSSDFDKEILVT